MKEIRLKEMFDCGCHLGTNIKNINPKMRPYIMSVHDDIAIIDILKTYTRLFRITLFLKKVIATEGYRVLFVGTQKSVAPIIASVATRSSSNYINERWKGGFLTNFKTMKKNENRGIEKSYKNEENAKIRVGSLARSTSIQSSDSLKNSSVGLELNTLPDIVIIVGQHKEMKAIKECKKLNIPTITILDSDGDPSLTNLFIPANDDSSSSVECILKPIGGAVLLGKYLYDQKKKTNRTQIASSRKSSFPRKKNG